MPCGSERAIQCCQNTAVQIQCKESKKFASSMDSEIHPQLELHEQAILRIGRYLIPNKGEAQYSDQKMAKSC